LDRRLPEQELTVEVGNIDGIHVNNMDVLEARQGQVGQNLATESTSSNDKDLDLISEKVLDLRKTMRGTNTTSGLATRTMSPAAKPSSVRGPGAFKT